SGVREILWEIPLNTKYLVIGPPFRPLPPSVGGSASSFHLLDGRAIEGGHPTRVGSMAVTRGRGSRRRLETAETPLLPLLAALCRSLPRTRRKIASLLSVGTVFEPEGRGFESLPARQHFSY